MIDAEIKFADDFDEFVQSMPAHVTFTGKMGKDKCEKFKKKMTLKLATDNLKWRKRYNGMVKTKDEKIQELKDEVLAFKLQERNRNDEVWSAKCKYNALKAHYDIQVDELKKLQSKLVDANMKIMKLKGPEYTFEV